MGSNRIIDVSIYLLKKYPMVYCSKAKTDIFLHFNKIIQMKPVTIGLENEQINTEKSIDKANKARYNCK